MVSLAAGLAGLALLGYLLDSDPEGRATYSPHPVAGATFLIVGTTIMARQAKNRIGWLFVAIGITTGVVAATGSFAGARYSHWVNQFLTVVPYGLLPFALLLFPDGKLPSPRWKPAVWVGIFGVVTAVAGLAVAVWIHPPVMLERPSPFEGPVRLAFEASRVGALAIVLAVLLGIAALISRRRRSTDSDTRQQIRMLMLGGAAIPIGLVLEVFAIPGAGLVAAVSLPIAAGAAILKYRLYDLDLLLNRSLVYAVLTTVLVLTYAALATILGTAFSNTWGSPLLATGVVAIAFQPLRARIQIGVSRLLYGRTDDPYTIVSNLGRILEPAASQEAVLESVAVAVNESLGLPYAAIEVIDSSGGIRVAAASGRKRSEAESLPMVYAGRVVGNLVVCPRSARGSFSTRERALLANLARQTGAAVHTMRLTEDLRASRARLVRSREDERLRLRADLHDGLGPILAGAVMQVGTAREGSPQLVEIALGRLEQLLQGSLTEIRQIVNDLRPPSLDSLGLVGAIRDLAESLGRREAGPRIEVVATGLGELPAAVEVAAYRIVSEALTNVVKHAEAGACTVTIANDELLVIEIVDDGVGIPEHYLPGVGMGSMRDRAEELGGSWLADSRPGGGTRVLARLPLDP
jgi:signal transduction histidine kinase